MRPPKVISMGEALVDRLGPLGGDPLIDKPSKDCLGGAPANVACALGHLGVDVAFVGCVGDDQIGRDFKALMNIRGVNTSSFQTTCSAPTRVVLVRRELDGERSFGGFEGNQAGGFADQKIDRKLLSETWDALASEAHWLVLGTIPLASPTSSESVWFAVDKALSSNIRIAVDLNWRPTFWGDHFSKDSGPHNSERLAIDPLLKVASLLKLAKEEAIWFFNTDDPIKISQSLPNKPDVLVTDGSKAIKWLLMNFSGEMEAATPSTLIDTTGAGDAFTAGLICKYLRINSGEINQTEANEIIRFATACGALVCSGMGAIDPQPTFEEVQAFLSSIK